jgi:Domain of unknown function (DUF4328)
MPFTSVGQTVKCPRCQRVFELAQPKEERYEVPRRTVTKSAALDDVDLDSDIGSSRRHNEALGGTWSGYIAMVLIGVNVLAFLADVWIQVESVALIAEQQRRGVEDRPRFDLRLQIGRRAETTNVFIGLSFALAAVVFLVWLVEAYGNLSKLRAYGLSYSRMWAFLCWFFPPFANLFTPFPVLQEVWRASHPQAIDDPLAWRTTPFAPCVRWWWYCFIAAWALMGVQVVLGISFDNAPGTWILSAIAWAVFDACAVAAGVLIIYIILNVTCRQQERFERLQEIHD